MLAFQGTSGNPHKLDVGGGLCVLDDHRRFKLEELTKLFRALTEGDLPENFEMIGRRRPFPVSIVVNKRFGRGLMVGDIVVTFEVLESIFLWWVRQASPDPTVDEEDWLLCLRDNLDALCQTHLQSS